mgnify:CR=1 FL=1
MQYKYILTDSKGDFVEVYTNFDEALKNKRSGFEIYKLRSFDFRGYKTSGRNIEFLKKFQVIG